MTTTTQKLQVATDALKHIASNEAPGRSWLVAAEALGDINAPGTEQPTGDAARDDQLRLEGRKTAHADECAIMKGNKHYRERVFNQIVELDAADGLCRFTRIAATERAATQPAGEVTKELLKEAIFDKVARAEDLMTDQPPHKAMERFNEASKTLNELIDQLFATSSGSTEQPAAASVDGPEFETLLGELMARASMEDDTDNAMVAIYRHVDSWGAQQREAGRDEQSKYAATLANGMLKAQGEAFALTERVEAAEKERDFQMAQKEDNWRLLREGHVLLANAEKERDDLRAKLAEEKEFFDDLKVEFDKQNAAFWATSQKLVETEAQLARPVDLAGLTPAAWMRKTDITELTDSEPETNGWSVLYEGADVQALLAGQEPVAWISAKNLAAIKGKGMAYATGFDTGGQTPLYAAPQPAAKADAPADPLDSPLPCDVTVDAGAWLSATQAVMPDGSERGLAAAADAGSAP